MPSIASAPPSPTLSSKKRRRDHDNAFEASVISDVGVMNHGIQRDLAFATNPHISRHDPTIVNKMLGIAHQRSQLTPRSRQKRRRSSGSNESRGWRETDDSYMSKQEAMMGEKSATNSNYDLRKCHICSRKPTLKRELDEYGDCEGCGERTCYICMRQCAGLGLWSNKRKLYEDTYDDGGHEKLFDGMQQGPENRARLENWSVGNVVAHKEKVCSRCCVERGKEGDIWCLGCLRADD